MSPTSMSMYEQEDTEELSGIDRIETRYGLKILGAQHHHALVCTTCKVVHPLDTLKWHWGRYHSGSQLDESVISVLEAAGAWSQGIPLPEKKVPILAPLEDPRYGYWCSKCRKASPFLSTIDKSLEHHGCPGTISRSWVQKITKNNTYWAVIYHHQRDGSAGSVVLSEGQIEDEVEAQMNMLPDVMMEDHIITTNHRNINQFLSGTEWLDVLGMLPIQPIMDLVELPRIKSKGTKERFGDYPALSIFVENYIQSLLLDLHQLEPLLRQWLHTTKGYAGIL